jgi:hypothetical protein
MGGISVLHPNRPPIAVHSSDEVLGIRHPGGVYMAST